MQYTFALIVMWGTTVAAAYLSRYLPRARGYRTAFTFFPMLIFVLLNWQGHLDVWPLSTPLPDLGAVANPLVYSGAFAALGVFAMLRLVRHRTAEAD